MGFIGGVYHVAFVPVLILWLITSVIGRSRFHFCLFLGTLFGWVVGTFSIRLVGMLPVWYWIPGTGASLVILGLSYWILWRLR